MNDEATLNLLAAITALPAKVAPDDWVWVGTASISSGRDQVDGFVILQYRNRRSFGTIYSSDLASRLDPGDGQESQKDEALGIAPGTRQWQVDNAKVTRVGWPDGTRRTATSLEIGSVLGNGIGPVSFGAGGYTLPYPSVEFSTIVAQSEPSCKPNGNGCEVPPSGAAFYPFYGISKSRTTCYLTFGSDIRGSTINDFGRDEQYGEPVPGDSGVIASGVFPNPCVPN